MVTNLAASRHSLAGVALGDAFGQTWFSFPAEDAERAISERRAASGRWLWTDDTAMALSVFRVLREHGEVIQDELARMFASAYEVDPSRGYGPSMHRVLRAIGGGEPWELVTGRQFGGQGSWGNGAAMRVAPLGAWFAPDLGQVEAQAALSAAVTHAHPEAAAGAIAVAVAAALAVSGAPPAGFVAAVASRTPDGDTASRLRQVADRPFSLDPRHIAGEVGCGVQLSAPDTVPFTVWCAARHLDDLPGALWATASAGGDIDTTCAIVGGIVAARTGTTGIPAHWAASCEPLPAWVFT